MVKLGRVDRNLILRSGVPDPYGRRLWITVGADKAPLLNGMGDHQDRFESALPTKLKQVSREHAAMMLVPRLVIDFSGLCQQVRGGETWTRYWVGGNVRMRVKDFSGTYVWAGGPKSHELLVSRMWPAKRNKDGSLDVEAPCPKYAAFVPPLASSPSVQE